MPKPRKSRQVCPYSCVGPGGTGGVAGMGGRGEGVRGRGKGRKGEVGRGGEGTASPGPHDILRHTIRRAKTHTNNIIAHRLK